MKYLATILCLIMMAGNLTGQYHADVLKGTQSTVLFEQVVQAYTPVLRFDYGEARDTMFLEIDAVDRVLECVYTGLKITIPVGEDPTVAVFKNGINDGINTEHTYPRSKGAADEPAKSDMHNLYPTRVKTNSDRQSFEFGEISDSQTDRWYLNTTERSSIPTTNIDAYSELNTDGTPLFEPRESHKGDVARSMMYFYTMYRDKATAAAPNYFESQRETLCNWHFADPVDEKEWNRTWKIAMYQDDKPNPFVLDCSVAARLYCDQISDACAILTDVNDIDLPSFELYPNPSDGSSVTISSIDDLKSRYQVVNTAGKVVDAGKLNLRSGENLLSFGKVLSTGLYFLQFDVDGDRVNLKMVVL